MIARKTTLIIIQNFMGMLFGYVVLKFIAVELGENEFGMMAYGFSLVALLSFITNLGVGAAHMKRVSEGKDLGVCTGTYAMLKLILTAVMAGVFIIGLQVWKYLYPAGIENTTEGIMYAVLGYFVFQSIALIPIKTFDARAETFKSQAAYIVQHPFKLIGVLMVIFTASEAAKGMGMDPGVALNLTITYYTIVGLVVMVSGWALFMYYKYPIKRPTREMIKSYFKFALPAAFASFLSVLIMNTDKAMIGYFFSEVQVGDYFGVQKLAEIIMVVPVALSMILLPVFSQLATKKNKAEIRKLIISSERYTSMIVAPITFFMFFFSYEIIHLLLSDAFLNANWTLSFLGIYAFIVAITRPRIALLQGIDRPDLTAKITVVVASINIGLNLLLIPGWSWFRPTVVIPAFLSPHGVAHTIIMYNITGAAIATVIAQTVGFIGLRALTYSKAGAKLYHGFTIKHFFAATIMITALIYLVRLVELARWYHLFLFAGLGLCIYAGVLYLIKEFKKRDLHFFFGLMDPRAMGKYMKAEAKEKDLDSAMRRMSRDEEE